MLILWPLIWLPCPSRCDIFEFKLPSTCLLKNNFFLQLVYNFAFTATTYYLFGLPMELWRFSMYVLITNLVSMSTEGLGMAIGAVLHPTVRRTWLWNVPATRITCLLKQLRLLSARINHWSQYIEYIPGPGNLWIRFCVGHSVRNGITTKNFPYKIGPFSFGDHFLRIRPATDGLPCCVLFLRWSESVAQLGGRLWR